MLTLSSFLLIFLRRRTKKQLRESQRFSRYVRAAAGPQSRGQYSPPRTPGRGVEEDGYWVFVRDGELEPKAESEHSVQEVYYR